MSPPARRAISLVFLACTLITILLVFHAEEDWRGAHNWAACQRDLAAKGETLDLKQLIPPGAPEDDLSKTPIFAPLYQGETRAQAPIHQISTTFKSSQGLPPPKVVPYTAGHDFDLEVWQKYYRSVPEAGLSATSGTAAQDVLQVLSRWDPQMNEVDAAISNPNAHWPIYYNFPAATPLSGVTSMIGVAKVLELRGIAHLENNQVDAAAEDYLFSLRINHPLAGSSILVSYLVRIGVRAISDQILAEGLHHHAWSDSQLREFESALAENDMLALAAKSFRIERASMMKNLTATLPEKTLQRATANTGFQGPLGLWHRPIGWWNEDRANYCWKLQTHIDDIDVEGGRLPPGLFPRTELPEPEAWSTAEVVHVAHFVYNPISATSLPALENSGLNIAQAETNRRFARLACRLEEYRISHGQYPDKLDDLPNLPPHLNQEVVNDQPLHYQRKGDSYLLYSSGWDLKDDGGKPTTPDNKTDGDWVWPSP